MLHLGKTIERRKAYRNFYEMSKISLMPHMKDEGRKNLMGYYWEESLNDHEKAARDRVISQAKKDAEKSWAPSSAALDFFRRR